MRYRTIIVSCGARAAQIRQRLTDTGRPCRIRKIKANEGIAEYGEYEIVVAEADAIWIALAYPRYVRAVP